LALAEAGPPAIVGRPFLPAGGTLAVPAYFAGITLPV